MQLRNVPKLMSRVPTLVSNVAIFYPIIHYVSEKTYSNVCSFKNSTLSTCPTFAYNRYNEPSCSVECDIKEQRGYTYKKNRKCYYQSSCCIFYFAKCEFLPDTPLFISNKLLICLFNLFLAKVNIPKQCLKKFAKASVSWFSY